VSSDAEAVSLINDTEYGLTASIWTQDLEVAEQLGDLLDVGTVFTNRCDYVDPALAWTGTKQSGRGCTLSKFGFDALTRPKSFNLNATPRS
jgi:acyl-CoA reductase-like NAD-dependent aldehyde dehydrogenase